MSLFLTWWLLFLYFLFLHFIIPAILVHFSDTTISPVASTLFLHSYHIWTIFFTLSRCFLGFLLPNPLSSLVAKSSFLLDPLRTPFFYNSSFLPTSYSSLNGPPNPIPASLVHYYFIPRLIPALMVLLVTHAFRRLSSALFDQYGGFYPNSHNHMS